MTTVSQNFTCTTHNPLPVRDRTGNSHCFNCIIETHQSTGYNLARRLLNDWALAEDALQESFVAGYRAFSHYRGENLRAWMMRIIANTCRDTLRSRRARPAIPLSPLPRDEDDSDFTIADLPSGDESPEQYAERTELREAIQSGLASLPEERRLAIVLVDVQGFSYEEAAQVAGCAVGTVKSRISRGRSQLRDFLRETGELLPSQFRQEQ